MEKKVFWWNKEFTKKELMKNSKTILILIGAIYAMLGFTSFTRLISHPALDAIPTNRALAIGIMGILFVIGAFIPIFWLQFACITLWVIYLIYANLFIQIIPIFIPISILMLIFAIVFLYKMFKYRNNV